MKKLTLVQLENNIIILGQRIDVISGGSYGIKIIASASSIFFAVITLFVKSYPETLNVVEVGQAINIVLVVSVATPVIVVTLSLLNYIKLRRQRHLLRLKWIYELWKGG